MLYEYRYFMLLYILISGLIATSYYHKQIDKDFKEKKTFYKMTNKEITMSMLFGFILLPLHLFADLSNFKFRRK